MNYMEQIANMLGVELGEGFKINDGCGFLESGQIFQFTERGLVIQLDKNQSTSNRVLNKILTGKYEIVKIPWKPKNDEEYWMIDRLGMIFNFGWHNNMLDIMLYAFGNCFRTKADAEAHKEEMLAKMREVTGE